MSQRIACVPRFPMCTRMRSSGTTRTCVSEERRRQRPCLHSRTQGRSLRSHAPPEGARWNTSPYLEINVASCALVIIIESLEVKQRLWSHLVLRILKSAIFKTRKICHWCLENSTIQMPFSVLINQCLFILSYISRGKLVM